MLKWVEKGDARWLPVAAIVVTRERPDELAKTVEALRRQAANVTLTIFIVDSSTVAAAADAFDDVVGVTVLRSVVNLGGAGGFAFGMLAAMAAGNEWLWLMDDDGRPLHDFVLQDLLDEAKDRGLDAVAPVVLDSANHARFAFPYPIGRRYIFRRDEIAAAALIPSMAHLFNGLLIRAETVFKTGLPDLRLFIRGDEIDFLYRMRRAGLRFGTTTKVPFGHPSSNDELFPVWGGRLHVVYPAAGWKRRRQYRNRGYNFLRNREFLIIAVDLLRYPWFFLVHRHFDFAGLAEWFTCMWRGIRGEVHVEPAADLAPRVETRSMP